MIKHPVTFILGAGVSRDYGYPLGDGLHTSILSWSSQKFLNQRREMFEEIEHITGFDKHLILEFHDTLKQADNFSIDEFLRVHSKEFGEIGKFYIARIIFERERDVKPSSENSPYKHILKKYVLDITNLRKLTFLTFNYDLSLEKYMYDHFKYYLNIQSDQMINEYMDKIQIIHLHGRLGHLDFENEGGRKYGETQNIKKIYESSKDINIVYDRTDNKSEEFNKAYVCLDQSDFVIFLGFSYLEMSLNRFGLSSINKDRVHGKPPIRYTGTCLNRTRWENEVTNQLFKSYECDINFGDSHDTSVDFLRNSREFNISIVNP